MNTGRYLRIPLFLIGALGLSFLVSPFLFSVLLADIIEDPYFNESCAEILLTWGPVERAERYILYRDTEEIYRGAVRSHLDTPLVMNTRYAYSLVAVNRGGESEMSGEALISAERPCPPDPPEEIFVLDSPCGGVVTIEWTPPPRAERYQVVRDPVPVLTGGVFDWTEMNMIYEGTDTVLQEYGLKPGGYYSYGVRAWNETGWGEWNRKFIRASLECPPERPLPPVGI